MLYYILHTFSLFFLFFFLYYDSTISCIGPLQKTMDFDKSCDKAPLLRAITIWRWAARVVGSV